MGVLLELYKVEGGRGRREDVLIVVMVLGVREAEEAGEEDVEEEVDPGSNGRLRGRGRRWRRGRCFPRKKKDDRAG